MCVVWVVSESSLAALQVVCVSECVNDSGKKKRVRERRGKGGERERKRSRRSEESEEQVASFIWTTAARSSMTHAVLP